MIFRKHPEKVPNILETRGKQATSDLKDLWEAGQTEFKSDAFDSTIYSAASVKRALEHGGIEKCYYCETKYNVSAYGTVDHFRPKTIVNNTGRKADRQPGYYWLAYEWTNLLMACPRCNIRIKRNKFPLAPGSPRALSHHDKIEDEQPLLINPAVTDPSAHIRWRNDTPYAKNGSPRGACTIKTLELANRKVNKALVQHREVKFLGLWACFCLLQDHSGDCAWPKVIEATQELIEAAQQQEAEYCAMAREAIALWQDGKTPASCEEAPVEP